MSFMQVPEMYKAQMFVITGIYMAMTSVFFAFYIGKDTLVRFDIIRRSLTFAAFIASIIGIAGYFRLGGFKGGSADFQSEVAAYARAVGLFKDPNVFSTFLIFPILMMIQGFMLGTQRRKFFSAIALLIMLAAWFLAFSRGAWISLIVSFILMVGFTFVFAATNKLRGRISLYVVVFVGLTAVMLIILLSIPQVRDLFLDRFTLVKSYDSGETGRFGNQLNSIPMLLERPFGFGPFIYRTIFGIDPHNVYVNAFSSYGWLGGISYFTVIFFTLVIGLRSVTMRSPFQNIAIVVFCPLVATIFQGVQIDTDHWRHFYWLMGLTWGLYARNLAYNEALEFRWMRIKALRASYKNYGGEV